MTPVVVLNNGGITQSSHQSHQHQPQMKAFDYSGSIPCGARNRVTATASHQAQSKGNAATQQKFFVNDSRKIQFNK